ncbi:hypothetical protein KIU71_12990 [Alteromonas sp. SM 2104]|nr:hypothetical protein [Alteromonas oceanisediminis]
MFLTLACTISIAGIYLMISRGTVGSWPMHVMTGFSGVVVLVSSFFALRAALQKRFVEHRVWAIRLYLAANGVLFFRIMLFGWLMVFGQLGIDFATFTGPAIMFVSVASYLLPLAVFEFYQYSQRSGSTLINGLFTGLMCVVSLCFLIGTAGVVMGNWYPTLFPA